MFEIFVAHHETPIGILTISANHEGVTKIDFGKHGRQTKSNHILNQACRELDEYFAGTRREFEVPLSMSGTPFQKMVWNALSKIPYGAIPSYSDIAELIGRPKAARAVGMANNKNPVPIIVPCHRVIGRDGSLIGYAGGLDIKRKLLSVECGLSH